MEMTGDDVVLCTIIKGEHDYLEEWLEYNIKLGFDHIYLFDNDDIKPHVLPAKFKGKVTLSPLYGKMLQIFCYNRFLKNYREKHKWVAFLDADEFIVLRKHSTIKELVREHGKDTALALNWVLFGSCGLDKQEDKPVLERFTMRQHGVNQHVKVITRVSGMSCMSSPHHGKLLHGNTRDCKGRIVDGPYHHDGDDDIACIHHYFTKSKEEFVRKCQRGKADLPDHRVFDEDFWRHDLNEKQDLSALTFFSSF